MDGVTQKIDGVAVKTKWAEFCRDHIIAVEVGTTGYTHGVGHGTKTFFRLWDAAHADLNVHTRQTLKGGDQNVEILLRGDEELEGFLGALKFAASALESQIEENDKNEDLGHNANL